MIDNLKKSLVVLIALWTLMLLAIYGTVVYLHYLDTIKDMVNEARHYHTLNLHYRAWNASLGGVYADAAKVAPNPYLTVTNRDLTLPDGRKFTLVNPAYMTRMVFDTIRNSADNQVISKLTSRNFLNPGNAPDPWESAALKEFEEGNSKEKYERTVINDKPFLRLISPFFTDSACLKCHGHQGYKIGDVRGGISIAVPLGDHLASEVAMRVNLACAFFILWFLGVFGMVTTGRKHIRQAGEVNDYRNQLIDKLHALETAKTHGEQLSAKLSIIMDGIPALVAHVDVRERYIYANRSYVDWAGFSQDEIVGKTVREVLGEEAYAVSRENIGAALQGKAGELEREVMFAGQSRVQHICYVPQFDEQGALAAFFAFITDITDRKLADNALRESNERFSLAFENAPTIMAITTLEDGKCLDINQRFLDLSGFRREEVVGRTFIELGWITGEEERKLFGELKQTGRVSNLELQHKTKAGKQLFLNYSGQKIPIAGKDYLLSIIIDVTGQRLIEQQLFHSQKMEAIGQLAGGIAHDFNNLLQAINVFAYLAEMQLKEHGLPVQFAGEIIKAGNRAADLTMGLLAFSRKQSNDPKLTDLKSIIEDTHKLLSRVLAENIEFSLTYHGAPLMVMADTGQIQQVLINLATNARDAMPDGGQLQLVTGRAVIDEAFISHHGFGLSGDYAMLVASDSGHGMNSEVKAQIFDPFYTTKEQGKGTGLGLAIVYGIVKQHNGFITVESTRDAGTTFRIYLPEVAAAAGETVGTNASATLPGGQETILVVDDDKMVRAALGAILEAHGYRIIEAGDGRSAEEVFLARGSEIQLTVMDIVMPQRSGVETLQQLRTIRPDLPALFITGYADDIEQINNQLNEFTALLMKPVEPRQLLETMRLLLARNGTSVSP